MLKCGKDFVRMYGVIQDERNKSNKQNFNYITYGNTPPYLINYFEHSLIIYEMKV